VAIGELVVRIVGDTAGLTQALGDASKQAETFTGKARATLNTFAKASALAFAAAGAGAAVLVKETSAVIVEMQNMSRVANTGLSDFQAWAYAARSVGIEQDKLADILKDVNDRVGDFNATGGGPMADFFEKIAPRVGVTAAQFKNLSGADALQLYVSSLQQANLSQADMTFYMEAMASDSTRLLPLLKDNAAGFKAMADEAEQLGIILSDIDVAQVEQAQASMRRLESIGATFGQQLTIELAPIIEGIANDITAWAKEMGGFGNVARSAIDSVATGVGFVSDVWYGWQLIIKGTEAGILQLSATAVKAFADMSTPIEEAAGTSDGFFSGVLQRLADVSAAAQNWAFGTTLGQEMAGAGQAATTLATDLQLLADDASEAFTTLALQGAPSDGIKARVAEWRAASAEAAAARVELNNELSKPPVSAEVVAGSEAPSGGFADIDAVRARLAERYTTNAEFDALELERLQSQLQYENEINQEYYDLGLQSEQDYLLTKEQLALESADRMKAIQDREASQRLGLAKGMFGNLATLMNTGSRKLFEIGKAASLANAIVSGYEAVTSSYAAGARIGGPIVGAAFAATAAAATFAQIAQIRAASFGQTSAPVTFDNGVPTQATSGGQGNGGQGGNGRSVSVTLVGDTFGRDQVRSLIDQIGVEVRDGYTLTLGGT
jgi:hypothetical protein